MVKYVDSGMEDTSNGKKKVKKGFKEDRRANYEKMLAKKNGKFRGKEPVEKTARVKSVTFDPNALKDYVLTLHKRKNERRVQAFVDVKRKMRREHARDRRQQREEARLAYNNYARVPILPNYTYKLPRYEESDGEDSVDNFDEEEDQSNKNADAQAVEDENADLPWMFLGDGDASAQQAEDQQEEAPHGKRKRVAKRTRADDEDDVDVSPEEAARRARLARKRRLKLVTEASTVHSMPVSMTSALASTTDDAVQPSHSPLAVDTELVEVEVKPLFGRGGAVLDARGAPVVTAKTAAGQRGGGGRAAGSSLPSHDFSDLPAVVEEELLRLRKESKGPTRTKPKLQLLKELQKIRKIRKYSRKGHGKKTTSGKRKNRKR